MTYCATSACRVGRLADRVCVAVTLPAGRCFMDQVEHLLPMGQRDKCTVGWAKQRRQMLFIDLGKFGHYIPFYWSQDERRLDNGFGIRQSIRGGVLDQTAYLLCHSWSQVIWNWKREKDRGQHAWQWLSCLADGCTPGYGGRSKQ